MSLCCWLDQLNPLFNVLALLVLFATIACQVSGLARFYVKSLVLYVCLGLISITTLPQALWCGRDFVRFSLVVSKNWKWISQVLGIEWKVEGKEEVDKSRAYIVLCNHQSAVDSLAMMKVWPDLGPTVAMAKRELQLYTGTFGLILTLCGTIFIDRMASEKGRRTIAESGKFAKEKGISIFMFPEGTRNRRRDGSMLPFKKGAFHMAIDAGMPILPVVISEYDFLNPKEKRFESGSATIKVMKPIETKDYTKETLDDLIKKTRDTMIEELQAISGNNNKAAKKEN